ncbi:hypothetical protein Tco_0955081 [Tanacetum coccineum]|uniref:Uncharacterized protein n=1 Tax=Tanacetum coccineum TaxID=301880 RepID=A0ABQ5E665_9ASTR
MATSSISGFYRRRRVFVFSSEPCAVVFTTVLTLQLRVHVLVVNMDPNFKSFIEVVVVFNSTWVVLEIVASLFPIKSQNLGTWMFLRFCVKKSVGPRNISSTLCAYEPLRVVNGIAADAQRATSDSLKRKLKLDTDSYVFERYSHLCARNVVVMLLREISGHLQNGSVSTSMALNFGSIENEHSSSELAARDTKAAAKRPLLPQPSLEAKKKKRDYMRGRKNIE